MVQIYSSPLPTTPSLRPLETRRREALVKCHAADFEYVQASPLHKVFVRQMDSGLKAPLGLLSSIALITVIKPAQTLLLRQLSPVFPLFISTVASSYCTGQILALFRSLLAPLINQLSNLMKVEQEEELIKQWTQHYAFASTIEICENSNFNWFDWAKDLLQKKDLESSLDALAKMNEVFQSHQKESSKYVGIPMALLAEDDKLPEVASSDLMIKRQVARLELFYAEEEMRQAKTEQFLASAKSISSPSSKLLLLAGVVALAAIEVITTASDIYFLNNVGFSLKGAFNVFALTAVSSIAPLVIQQIRTQTRLTHLMQLGECAKTIGVYQDLMMAWEKRFQNYRTKMNLENVQVLVQIELKKEELKQRAETFKREMEQLGWVGSSLFTTSNKRFIGKELLFPDPTPLTLPNP